MGTPGLRDLRPGDLGWIVYSQGHANLRLASFAETGYWEQLGWNGEYEALIARIVADYAEGRDPARESGADVRQGRPGQPGLGPATALRRGVIRATAEIFGSGPASYRSLALSTTEC
jgi:hypothetical protein